MINSASGLVRYGWLHADTRPYPFFTRGITNKIDIVTESQVYNMIIFIDCIVT